MSGPLFDIFTFESALSTTAVGRELVYLETVDTTMVVARARAAEGAPHGTLILAEEQTAGRGRKGRSFASPPAENLYFTLILRLPGELHRRLPVAVPLAVCEAVRAEGIDARIKWPNDIWASGRKLCGMLIDAETADEGGFIAYPGIGINVNGDPTLIPELREIATSIRLQAGRAVGREELLARVCTRLEAALAAERAELAGRYRELSLVIGRQVTVTGSQGGQFDAFAEDVADDGSLVIRRDGGPPELVTAAEVSLRPS